MSARWTDPAGQTLGALSVTGELGISDGWLKWLRAPSSWDEPMEVPFEAWQGADGLSCVDGIVFDSGDGFSGTETELCEVAAGEALWRDQVELLAAAGVVGPEADAVAELATRELLRFLGAP